MDDITWMDDITDSVDMSVSTPQGKVKDRETGCAAVHGVAKRWTQRPNNNTTFATE